MKSLKLIIIVLFGILIATCCFTLTGQGITDTKKEGNISLGPAVRVGQDGSSTRFSYFNTSPESPDGTRIIYVRLKKEPIGLERSAKVPGELWLCDSDLKGSRLVADLKSISWEDGALQQWVDNNHVALLDSGTVRVIDVRNGRDILKKKIETPFLGHDSSHGKILFTITKPQGNSRSGIYELNCFTEEIKPVLLKADCHNVVLPSNLDSKQVVPVEYWRFLHCQYSPDGKKVCFRIDIGRPDSYQVLGICNIDGSGFKITNKPLHQMWYDNESIMGHVRFGEHGEPLSREKKFFLMRWDLDGNYIEAMGIKGNHLAVSPARDCFVSETMYHTNPVIVTLTLKGQENSTIEIDRFDPHNLTWNSFFHVNPAFSRNGKRIYYAKPLNEEYNGTFFREIKHK